MKNYRFTRRRFFINNFFGVRYENENGTIVFALSNRFEICNFDLERSISKSDLSQVSSWSGHDPSRSIYISFEEASRAKSFGTICASLSPFCRELLAKN